MPPDEDARAELSHLIDLIDADEPHRNAHTCHSTAPYRPKFEEHGNLADIGIGLNSRSLRLISLPVHVLPEC